MVDLGGYIIMLTNNNGKIKLYGSPADNADSLEFGDEILEVNGRKLENSTHSEVIQYIHQCIKSRTICLRVRRRSGNKIDLDGPNAVRIRDAWVIAVERGARERLQRLTALRRIQPRDIQAILHQQINEAAGASTSEESPGKNVINNQVTITVADKDLNATNTCTPKLSNGTIPKGLKKDSQESNLRDTKIPLTAQEKQQQQQQQHSTSEESNLLQPVQTGKVGERRASSPFQNGRTEVLIGEPEGGPRSPRGSTSFATNDSNLLNPQDQEKDPEPIYRKSGRRIIKPNNKRKKKRQPNALAVQ